MIFSFILPVYNVEPYLRKCLDSIYGQDIPESDYEIVAVNDGSKDNSLQVLEDYASHHSNFILFDKENGGVSSARNKGMELASGDYLVFVDPDDFLFPNVLHTIKENLISRPCDILILRSRAEKDGTYFVDWINQCEESVVYKGVDLFGKYSRGCVWGGCFSKQFIMNNKLLFPLGVRNGEDATFMAMSQVVAERFCFFNIDFYAVYRRDDSASQNITEEAVYRMKYCLDALRKLRDCQDYNTEQKRFFENLTYRMLSNMTNMAMLVKGMNYRKLCDKVPVKKYLPIVKDGFTFKNRKIDIINNSYRFYYLLCKIKRTFNKPQFT